MKIKREDKNVITHHLVMVTSALTTILKQLRHIRHEEKASRLHAKMEKLSEVAFNFSSLSLDSFDQLPKNWPLDLSKSLLNILKLADELSLRTSLSREWDETFESLCLACEDALSHFSILPSSMYEIFIKT